MKVIVKAVLLLLLLSSTAHAQLREFDITSIPPSGPIPVFRDHPDKVAVILRSSLTNLRFDSNLGVTAELSYASRGEYVLILDPVRQSVTVNAPGYQQSRIQITLTEARQVAYYRVEPKPEVATNLIPTIVQITPTDAKVTIDGNLVDITKPVPIEIGTHRIRIEKQGFRTIEKEVRISADQNLIRETLSAIEVVPITIKTQPAGATVLLDGIQVGVTDRNGDIGLFRFPGTYELSVQLSGHVSETRNITVSESGPNATTVNLIRNAGTLRLTVTPSDAIVLLNRQPHNPSQPAELAPGMVLVEVSKPDHDSVSETVEIVRGQTVSRNISLTPHLGGFQITPTPLQASWILTDASGKVVMSGTGLARKSGVLVGHYSLLVRASGYQDFIDKIHVERNMVSERNVALRAGLACGAPITDIEGNTYKTIQIGEQCWMAENLKTTKYRDGSPIPNANDRQWSDLSEGVWAVYDNDTVNNEIYGKLYNWYAVNDSRELCPIGWHVPDEVDWNQIKAFLGSEPGSKIKITSFNGSNSVGFNALPGGYRQASTRKDDFFGHNGHFVGIWTNAYFLSSSIKRGSALVQLLDRDDSGLFERFYNFGSGFSVRCIRD